MNKKETFKFVFRMFNVPWQNIILMETPHVYWIPHEEVSAKRCTLQYFSLASSKSHPVPSRMFTRSSPCELPECCGSFIQMWAGNGGRKVSHLNIFSVKSLTWREKLMTWHSKNINSCNIKLFIAVSECERVCVSGGSKQLKIIPSSAESFMESYFRTSHGKWEMRNFVCLFACLASRGAMYLKGIMAL